MYKNFKITEEEKKQILESHRKHGYKSVIKEQEESNDCNIQNVLNKIEKMGLNRDSTHTYVEYLDSSKKNVVTGRGIGGKPTYGNIEIHEYQVSFETKDDNIRGYISLGVYAEKYQNKWFIEIKDYNSGRINFMDDNYCEFKDREDVEKLYDMIESNSSYTIEEMIEEDFREHGSFSHDDYNDNDYDTDYHDGMSDRERMYQDRRDYGKERKDWDDEQRREFGAGA